MEYFVHLRLQGHPDHRLRHPVNDIGNTENPYASLLRYFHRADRTGKIRPRRHAIPQLVQVILHIDLELLDRHAIRPGRSSILLNPQPRIPHEAFRYVMRLALQTWLMHALPPFRLTASISPGRPLPLAPRRPR